jgi:DNA-binding CsgD family transcriptional regulator
MSPVSPAATDVRLHPWLVTLRSFDVPFLGYSVGGALAFASKSPGAVLDEQWMGLRRQAGYLVAEAVGWRAERVPGAAWVPLRSVPAADAPVLLTLFVCADRAEAMPLAVVLSPLATPRESATGLALSARQLEVARLLASGASVKLVAARLGITVHTARRHVEHVYRRLGVHSRAELVRVVV